MAGGGDVILIPEIAWTFENVCHKILEREHNGRKFTLVVVAEGAELPDGGMVRRARRTSARRNWAASATSWPTKSNADSLKETRTVVLGHLQRGGPPTTFDRVLATQYGAHAVRLIVEGRLGEMICYHPPQMDSVPIMEAVNRISHGRCRTARPCRRPSAGHLLRRRGGNDEPIRCSYWQRGDLLRRGTRRRFRAGYGRGGDRRSSLPIDVQRFIGPSGRLTGEPLSVD